MTKLELDLYYVTTKTYIKFEVNISKDSREKSGKLKCDRLTDGLTDRRTASKLRVPRQVGRGLIIELQNCTQVYCPIVYLKQLSIVNRLTAYTNTSSHLVRSGHCNDNDIVK